MDRWRALITVANGASNVIEIKMNVSTMNANNEEMETSLDAINAIQVITSRSWINKLKLADVLRKLTVKMPWTNLKIH